MSDFTSTLKDIKSGGYWVFHIDSARPKQNFNDSHPQLQEFVQQNKIELRGWDYPHFPTHNGERQGLSNIDGGIASWCNADMMKEIWRLFFDGEFIHYDALNEDWYASDAWVANQAPYNTVSSHTVVDTINILFRLTEFFEFAKRLAISDFYNSDIMINIELRHVMDRRLVLLDQRRVPLRGNYRSAQDTISAFNKSVSVRDLRVESSNYALEAAVRVFHLFQWNTVSKDQLLADQQKLLERRLNF